jgi:hypothetical protein
MSGSVWASSSVVLAFLLLRSSARAKDCLWLPWLLAQPASVGALRDCQAPYNQCEKEFVHVLYISRDAGFATVRRAPGALISGCRVDSTNRRSRGGRKAAVAHVKNCTLRVVASDAKRRSEVVAASDFACQGHDDCDSRRTKSVFVPLLEFNHGVLRMEEARAN